MGSIRLLVCGGLLLCAPVLRSATEVNYDESHVPSYTLPDPLVSLSGERVATVEDWKNGRRAEILDLFAEHVYGRVPALEIDLSLVVRSVDPAALGGLATRKEVTVYPFARRDLASFELLLYLPNAAAKPVPAFLALNFNGNHSIHPDPGITLSERWMRGGQGDGVVNHRAVEAGRGRSANRWPLETILGRGYAVATVYYGDFEPDHAEGWRDGVRGAVDPRGAQTEWDPDDWGAISAWAWGLSRALDCLQRDPEIDGTRVAVLGHSRLGKTALWAGAQDERFALVISNDSGEGGAALARRRFGETTAAINRSFPHWFCGRFKDYSDREDAMPVDQHLLLALVAPRPLYVASAEEDRWADPYGEFLSAVHASPVYELFGLSGLGTTQMPSVNQPVGGAIGYHVRTGKHDVTEYDWDRYLGFADRHLGRISPGAMP